MTKEKADIKKKLNILEEIARQYNSCSPEHEAISCAAKALLFVNMRNVAEQFKIFMDASDRELSETQREYLQALGICEK